MARLRELIHAYQPQVVITYDDKGAYQHPDHVHAAVCTQAAVAATGTAKLYLTAMRRSGWEKVMAALAAQGIEVPDMPELTPELERQLAEEERRITTSVDIGAVLDRKRDALLAHSSQIDDSWFAKIPPEVTAEVFGTEEFIRAADTTGAPVPETDLFAGLR